MLVLRFGVFVVNVTWFACRTPLMLATLGGHVDCVHMLLERGSKPDAGDRRSRNALHRAVSVFQCVCLCMKLPQAHDQT